MTERKGLARWCFPFRSLGDRRCLSGRRSAGAGERWILRESGVSSSQLPGEQLQRFTWVLPGG